MKFKAGDKVRVANTRATVLLDPTHVYTVKDTIESEKTVIIEGTYKDGTWPTNGLNESYFELVPEDFYDNWSTKFAKHYNKEIDMDNNPKTAVALNKPRLSDVPPVALFTLGAAMSDGAKKYGRFNWRDTSVTASVFYDAMMRHLTAWYNGENHADDSHVHHLGHLMASCAILLDAEVHGVFKDDRDSRKPENISKYKEYWMSSNN